MLGAHFSQARWVEVRPHPSRLARRLGEAVANTVLQLAFVLCIAISSACSRAPDAPLLPTYSGGTGGDQPAILGEIVVNHDGCIALQFEQSSGSMPLLWPERYSIERTEHDTWEIGGGPDDSILPVGSMVSISAKQISGIEAQRISPGYPGSHCLKGETLQVVGSPVLDQI